MPPGPEPREDGYDSDSDQKLRYDQPGFGLPQDIGPLRDIFMGDMQWLTRELQRAESQPLFNSYLQARIADGAEYDVTPWGSDEGDRLEDLLDWLEWFQRQSGPARADVEPTASFTSAGSGAARGALANSLLEEKVAEKPAEAGIQKSTEREKTESAPEKQRDADAAATDAEIEKSKETEKTESALSDAANADAETVPEKDRDADAAATEAEVENTEEKEPEKQRDADATEAVVENEKSEVGAEKAADTEAAVETRDAATQKVIEKSENEKAQIQAQVEAETEAAAADATQTTDGAATGKTPPPPPESIQELKNIAVETPPPMIPAPEPSLDGLSAPLVQALAKPKCRVQSQSKLASFFATSENNVSESEKFLQQMQQPHTNTLALAIATPVKEEPQSPVVPEAKARRRQKKADVQAAEDAALAQIEAEEKSGKRKHGSDVVTLPEKHDKNKEKKDNKKDKDSDNKKDKSKKSKKDKKDKKEKKKNKGEKGEKGSPKSRSKAPKAQAKPKATPKVRMRAKKG